MRFIPRLPSSFTLPSIPSHRGRGGHSLPVSRLFTAGIGQAVFLQTPRRICAAQLPFACGRMKLPAASCGVSSSLLAVIPCLTEPARYSIRGNPVGFSGYRRLSRTPTRLPKSSTAGRSGIRRYDEFAASRGECTRRDSLCLPLPLHNLQSLIPLPWWEGLGEGEIILCSRLTLNTSFSMMPSN